MAVIDGVISSPAGGAREQDGAWSLVITLAPWRDPDGHIQQQALRVEQRVGSRSKLDLAMERLCERDPVRVTTAGVSPPRPGFAWWDCAAATRIAKIAMPSDLEVAQRERDRPVVVRDPQLGRFVLDRRLGAFVCKRGRLGKRYELMIAEAIGTSPAAQVQSARARVLAFEHAYARILEAVIAEKLRLYNDNWRGNRRRLTPRAFRSRLRLQSVHVAPSRTTAYIGAGTLFEDHVIEVRIDPQANIREILLAG